MSESQESRRFDLQSLIRDRRLDIIPASTYGVDRYSHPWMAADPSFARLLEYSDRREHIFAMHLSYYASFGVTDVLGVSDPRGGRAQHLPGRRRDPHRVGPPHAKGRPDRALHGK